ncbi:hypothetical protein EBR25_02470 [bacterium]|nr:hypothetical protein [bacterium]
MTEINESFFRTNIAQVKTELKEYQAAQKELNADHSVGNWGRGCVSQNFWCGDRNGYQRSVFLRRQINFLSGKLEQFISMLERFLKKQSEAEVRCGNASEDKPLEKPGCEHSSTDGVGDSGSDPSAGEPAPVENTGANSGSPAVDTQSSEVETSQQEYPWLEKSSCRTFVADLLGKKKGDLVSEERLQHGLVAFLLKHMHGDDVLAAYLEMRKGVRVTDQTNRVEEKTSGALKELVRTGTLTQEQAENINGLTFRAAQLDDRGKKLGGRLGTDAAVDKVFKAINKAFDHIFTALNGATPIKGRAL